MRSQISWLDTALRNSQDGISLLQTAEGALGETNSMLQRMRELAVQASNDSLTSNDRQYIQLEINELRDQINMIAGTTQFNKKRILDGSSGTLWTSSDLNLKARVNGGLSYVDEFGQKVNADGAYHIYGDNDPATTTTNHIKVDGVKAKILLEDVNIDTCNGDYINDNDNIDSSLCAFELKEATLNLQLAGENSLISGYRCAGIAVP